MKRKKLRLLSKALFLILFVCQNSFAAGETLMQSASARAQGMGEAYVSIPADEGGILTYHYNPSAIAFSKSMETAFTFKRGVADDNFTLISFGTPTQWGKFAGTFLYYSVGDIDLITTAGISRSVTAQKDLSAILTYSITLGETVALGINWKYLRSELIESFTANALAADIGTQVKIKNVVVGAAVQNVGPHIKYNRTNDPLPLTLRSGLSYRKEWSEEYRTVAAFDLMKEKGQKAKANIGLEYSFVGDLLSSQSELSLRTGYIVDQDNGLISLGLGFNINRYRIDYAMQLMNTLGNSYLVTFGFVFGGS